MKLGQPVAIVGEPGEDVSALAGQAGAAAVTPAAASAPAKDMKAPPASAPSAPAAQAPATTPPPETAAPVAQRNPPVVNVLERASFPGDGSTGGVGEGTDSGRILASPYVRKVAREMGIDLKARKGAGRVAGGSSRRSRSR